jgi:flagellar hook-length control protein FliK
LKPAGVDQPSPSRVDPPRRTDQLRVAEETRPRVTVPRGETVRRIDPPRRHDESRADPNAVDREISAPPPEADEAQLLPAAPGDAGAARPPLEAVNEEKPQEDDGKEGDRALLDATVSAEGPDVEGSEGPQVPVDPGTSDGTPPPIPAGETGACLALPTPDQDASALVTAPHPALGGLGRAVAAIENQGRDLPTGLKKASDSHAAANQPDHKPEPVDPDAGAPESPFETLSLRAEQAQANPGSLAQAPFRSDASAQAHGSQAHAPSAQTPVSPQVPLGAVPIEIGLKSLAGVNRFEIRLDPAELGRIDVRLDIGEAGEVKAHLVVDRVETLALLQRDAKTLERAFEQAGLKPSEGGIDLSLRDPSGERRGGNESGNERDRRATPRPEDVPVDGRESAPLPPRTVWRGTAGVDLRI